MKREKPNREEEYRKLLKIDENALDEEIINQPSLFFNVSFEYTRAASVRDRLKEEVKRVDAGLLKKARAKIEKMGDRVSDQKIVSVITTMDEHVEAVDNYLAAVERAAVLEALKEAIQQKSYMLRELAGLYVAGYYSNSSVVDGSRGSSDAAYDANRRRLAETRKPLSKKRRS